MPILCRGVKSLWVLALVSLLSAQRIKAVFGLLEGNGTTYPNSGLYYRWEDIGNGSVSSFAGNLQGVEPLGSDLAYDPRTKLLFVVGGGSAGNWRGSVYALDIWRSLVPHIAYLDSIEARRLAIRETLLLTTRNRPPFFTAYKITYDATQGTLQLDSLWSPSSPLLRSVPDALLLWGDTAYIGLSYDPITFAPDSLVLAINLRTHQVVGSWTVHPNPTELVRIGNSLYAACYGNFSSNLRISRIQPSSASVTVWDAGHFSFGGFVTDTNGVKDTILFWSIDDTLRAFSVATGQTAPGAYLGLARGTPGVFSYGLLWVGQLLFMSFTNYTDTSLIIFRDPTWEPTPPHLDTAFVSFGLGGIGYPSLRRFIYVEDDTTRNTSSTGYTYSPSAPPIQFWPNPASQYLFWQSTLPVQQISLWTPTGQLVRTYPAVAPTLFVGDLPKGLYFLRAESPEGKLFLYPLLKE